MRGQLFLTNLIRAGRFEAVSFVSSVSFRGILRCILVSLFDIDGFSSAFGPAVSDTFLATSSLFSSLRAYHFRSQVASKIAPETAPKRPPNGTETAPKRPPGARRPPRAILTPSGPPLDPPLGPQVGPKLAPSWPQVGPKSAGRHFKTRQNGFEEASCAEDDSKIEVGAEKRPVSDPPEGKKSRSCFDTVQISSFPPLTQKDPLRRPKLARSWPKVGPKLAPSWLRSGLEAASSPVLSAFLVRARFF